MGSELKTQEAQPVATAPASTEAAQFIAVIERAASNPDVDVDKMERLLTMQERVLNRNAEQAFSIAMSQAQSEMGPVSADAVNPQTGSKYASYAKLDSALRPIYTRHGFSISFDTGESPQDTVKVICYVSHSAGHMRPYSVVMPADGKGAKGGDVMTKTHAAGAGMAYGMRYLLKLIFNVAVGEADTDGNPPPKVKTVSEGQQEELRKAMKVAGIDEDDFCYQAQVESLDELQAHRFKRAMAHLKNEAQKGAQ